MTKLFASMIFLALLLPGLMLGQNRLDPQQATQALSAVEMRAPSRGRSAIGLPMLRTAAIIPEPRFNDYGEKFWLNILASGNYVVQGQECGSERVVRLGEFGFEFSPGTYSTFVVLDTGAIREVIPGLPAICAINLFRLYAGELRGLTIPVGQPSLHTFAIVGDGVSSEGESILDLAGNVKLESMVLLGRNTLPTRKEMLSNGVVRYYFSNGSYFPQGVPTITVCEDGTCETQFIFRRGGSASSGKG